MRCYSGIFLAIPLIISSLESCAERCQLLHTFLPNARDVARHFATYPGNLYVSYAELALSKVAWCLYSVVFETQNSCHTKFNWNNFVKVLISLTQTKKYMFLKRFHNVIILQFVFQGTRGKGYKGDIALDDIRVLDGTCPPSRMLNFAFVFNIFVVFPCKSCPSFSPFKVRRSLYLIRPEVYVKSLICASRSASQNWFRKIANKFLKAWEDIKELRSKLSDWWNKSHEFLRSSLNEAFFFSLKCP